MGRLQARSYKDYRGWVRLTHSVPPETKITQAELRRKDVFSEGEGI